MISTYKKGKDISVMIWGAIWIRGWSDVVLLERDPDAPHRGYSVIRTSISSLSNYLLSTNLI